MNKRKLPDMPAISLFFAMVVLALVMVFMPGARPYDDTPSRGLKKLYLTLNGFELDDIKELPRGTEFTGNSGVLTVRDKEQFELSEVTLKGRGNSTWSQDKAPLLLKTDNKVDLLDTSKSRKWVLLANYFDDSNIRNAIGLDIARALGMPYTVNGDFVELYADGEYRGLYYMTEKVEIGKGRVDLREPDGVLVERRTSARSDSGDICYRVIESLCFVVSDLVAKDNEAESMASFTNDFMKVERAIDAGDYNTIKKYVDTRSAAQYYLLSEITVDPDAYLTSQFLYRDGADDLIHFGPGWDFDFALGNVRWVWTDDEDYLSPTALSKNIPEGNFFEKLLGFDEFQAEAKELYNSTIRLRRDEILNAAKREADRISLPAMVNNIWWDMKDYKTEVKLLLDWLETRLNYLDGVFSEVVE